MSGTRRVWVVEPDLTLEAVLRELFESEGFCASCATLAEIHHAVSHGQRGVLVVDAFALSINAGRQPPHLATLSQVIPIMVVRSDGIVLDQGNVGSAYVMNDALLEINELIRMVQILSQAIQCDPPILYGVF